MNTRNYNLLARLYAGDLTERETARLKEELLSTAEGRRLYDEMVLIVSSLPDGFAEEVPDAQEEWEKLAQRLELSSYVAGSLAGRGNRLHMPDSLSPRSKAARIFSPIAWAAAAVITVLVIYGGLNLTGEHKTEEYRTAAAEKTRLALPDGSTAWMNNDSRVEYAENFTDDRRISIDGEVHFDVVSLPDRPFRVTSGTAMTTVLGTRFSIWSRNMVTRVSVTHGRVRLAAAIDPQGSAVLLEAGEVSELGENGIPSPPHQLALYPVPGWVAGTLVFSEEPINRIAENLSRVYDVPIKLQMASPERHIATGTFNEQSLEEVISTLCLALDLEYTIEDKYIVIKD